MTPEHTPSTGQPSDALGRFGQSTPYRMTVTTPRPHQDTVSLADQLLAAWLKQEGCEEPPAGSTAPEAGSAALPAERLRLGDRVLLDRDFGPLLGGPSQGHYTRRRLRTPAPHGTHQLTLTVASPAADGGPADAQTWVRLEAEHLAAGPGVRTAGRVPVPELARNLLPLLDATDGPAAVGPAPRLITPAGVDALIDDLCDPERRLPTIVASVPPAAPFDSWLADTVQPLVRHLTGLAVLCVLDHAALPVFNVALEYHKVYGGAVRTYLPEVDPASRYDGTRHPVMPRHRIEEDVRRAAALLAREPRRSAAELPLPALLAAVPVLQVPPEAKRTARPGQVHDQQPDAAEQQARADELQRIRHSLYRSRRRERHLLAENDEQCAALRHVSAQVRVLTGRLCSAAGPEAVDLVRLAAEARADEDTAPANFSELVGRFGEFPLLEFTGDQKEALALDGQCSGTGWARLTWEGLTALQEYAAAAVRGEAGGDFKQWCEHTPPGCHRFPPRKAVRGESRTVESHTKWKRERMLPVPECVDSSRRAFMGAHLRIGGGRTAPRLHYLDDCSGSGRIYVGYIGLHLTNTRTN
ncbi:hypothetical protein GCM10010193_66820 [Kitasatospora atroaurantiaca]|uniref:Uncharacterized protein n=1 Tax=Kitasatospora atroaurantiaca TaxID=285545 RepID=A0A561EVZ1_9ACTN|nr:hypothetical protein [Kitasatospora atroaurantiaca]TWE19774.1 hypothetical protein FB465_4906 [Kitasatospora atroaurantiaca]